MRRISRVRTVDSSGTEKRWKERADMAINARDVIAALPQSRQKKIRAMAERIIDREYSSPAESVEFGFTLTLEGISQLTPEVVAAFDEAGCADALLSSRDGVVTMDFVRAAPSKEDAIIGAIGDIERANVGARVKQLEPETADAAQDDLATAVNSVLAARTTLTAVPKLVGLLDF